MPLVAAAVKGLDAAHAAAALRDGQSVSISVGGRDHALTADDLLVSMKPLEGYQIEREGSHAVALELELDDELRAEGWARDIVRAIQNARQQAGFEVSDRIVLTLDGDRRLLNAARVHQEYIAGEVLATSVVFGDQPDGSGAAHEGEAGSRAGGIPDGAAPVMIDGAPLKIGVALA
jgi:isoleucyl-tRNA synthetase